MSRPLRLGLAGATGALGGEVLALLGESPLGVASLSPFASQRSYGETVDFRGESLAVASEVALRGLDLLILCTPPDAALGWVREALRAQVPCIDASGALALSAEVPLCVAALAGPELLRAPLIASPPGGALPLALVLAALERTAGLVRVEATVLESAAAGGREGIAALGAEAVALFNQADAPEPSAARPLAFDCHPAIGDVQEDGSTAWEARLAGTLARMLGRELPLSLAVAQIAVFVGQATALRVETARPLDPKAAREALEAAPGVELWSHDAEGPNLRAAAGHGAVWVGRLRADPSRERGLALWLAADPLRLGAANVVALAERHAAAG